MGQPRGIQWGGKWEAGSGQGDTCIPVADSCQHMAKPPQYYQVIRLQLKLINF